MLYRLKGRARQGVVPFFIGKGAQRSISSAVRAELTRFKAR